MQNSFSFHRLSLLIRKQWIENRRFYGLATIASTVLMAISFILFWLLIQHSHYREEQTIAIYFVGLFLIGCLFSSNAYQVLGEKEKGQYLLSLPATHAEKLVTTILFTTVLFVLLYSGIFLLVKALAVAFIKYKGWEYQPMNLRPQGRQAISYLFLGFFAVQALFLLGSVYFRKYAFVMTIIFGVAFSALYIYLLVKTVEAFMPLNFHWEGNRVVENNLPGDNSIYHVYTFGTFAEKFFMGFIKWIWAPVFWLATWFRLKEKEI